MFEKKHRFVLVFCIIVAANFVYATTPFCLEKKGVLKCHGQTMTFEKRDIMYAIPSTPAPNDGYPIVLLFQGTATPIDFTRTHETRFNTYYELKTIEALVNAGYAVIAPKALHGYAWQTNMTLFYKLSNDYAFFKKLLSAIHKGKFGSLDYKKQFAAGFSSGGYNTSRMAITFQKQFKAIAIQSGSYATCAGLACSIPQLPLNHPPTLFLHGNQDLVVPLWTAQTYQQKLANLGVLTRLVATDGLGHGWSPDAPEEITAWFNRFLD